jgi:hypothetical protein
MSLTNWQYRRELHYGMILWSPQLEMVIAFQEILNTRRDDEPINA